MDKTAIAGKLQSRLPLAEESGRPCAVLALLAEDRLILEVRSPLLRTQPGQICLPGGRMEPDETPIFCALRETEEELGLPSRQIQVLGQLDCCLHITGQTVYPVLAQLKEAHLNALRPNPAEVAEVFAVPLEWFRSHPPTVYEYPPQNVEADALPAQLKLWLSHAAVRRRGIWWQYEDKLIWGLTAKIICQVLDVTREGEI